MTPSQSTRTGAFDRAGVVVSAACFAHCVATPIVFSLLPVYAHLLPAEETTHRVLALFVTAFGAAALFMGYRKHKRRSVLVLMFTGLSLIFTGAIYGDRLPSHWLEIAITLAGSLCMISAHRRNHTFCKQCESCT